LQLQVISFQYIQLSIQTPCLVTNTWQVVSEMGQYNTLYNILILRIGLMAQLLQKKVKWNFHNVINIFILHMKNLCFQVWHISYDRKWYLYMEVVIWNITSSGAEYTWVIWRSWQAAQFSMWKKRKVHRTDSSHACFYSHAT
jgi:hypothetical protein